eukprot:gene8250-biopygen3116
MTPRRRKHKKLCFGTRKVSHSGNRAGPPQNTGGGVIPLPGWRPDWMPAADRVDPANPPRGDHPSPSGPTGPRRPGRPGRLGRAGWAEVAGRAGLAHVARASTPGLRGL